MTNKNDLTEFQEKVFSEYKSYKSLKNSTEQIKKDREKKGCLSVPMLMFADLVINKAVKSESRKKNYAGNERESAELLRQKEISGRVCEMIAKISRREILTEEKFVNELTAEFYRSDLAKQFVIPENAVLYALMATEIYNVGLENFCKDKKSGK